MRNQFKRLAEGLRLSLPTRPEKPTPTPRKTRSPAHLRQWSATIGGQTLTCRAPDQSTARALFKRELGLRRLPAGTQIHKWLVVVDAA